MANPFDILIDQHRELEECFERLASEGDAGELRSQTAELLELLRLHSRQEERCFHPLLMQVEGRARARLLALEELVVAHFQEEESALLPRLRATLDAQQQDGLRRELSLTREELLARAQAFYVPGRAPLLESLRWDG